MARKLNNKEKLMLLTYVSIADSYDELPDRIQKELDTKNSYESKWADVTRWLNDKKLEIKRRSNNYYGIQE